MVFAVSRCATAQQMIRSGSMIHSDALRPFRAALSREHTSITIKSLIKATVLYTG